MAEARAAHAEQFDDAEQQRLAVTLGMWVFLVTELMLFGGLFTAYTAYRWLYHPAWVEGSRHMHVVVGAVNTAVLILSSLTMALAVHAGHLGHSRRVVRYLLLTAALGTVFLGFKGYEYWSHAHEGLVPGAAWHPAGPEVPQLQIFFWLYYGMTGLHALHLSVGIVLVGIIAVLAWRGMFTATYHNPVEVTGLYWHLFDVIWIFLFPLFYLIE